MKRYEIPRWAFEKAKEMGLKEGIWLERPYPTNIDQAKELAGQLEKARQWFMDVVEKLHQFPESVEFWYSYSKLYVEYCEYDNKLRIRIPEKTPLYSEELLDGIPVKYDGDDVKPNVAEMTITHFGILLDRIVREAKSWLAYLEEEVGP